MNLALELPTAHLEELSKLTDIDFALAQNVLEDKVYAEFYKEQAARYDRTVILDNGFHELGRPLSIPELLEAYRKIMPTFVIAPDWLGDTEKSYDGFRDAARVFPSHRLAVVMQGGDDSILRATYFSNLEGKIGMLCFPFRANRLDWIHSLLRQFQIGRWPPFLHMLGVNELNELPSLSLAFRGAGTSSSRLSVDTAKPIKWAKSLQRMSDLQSVRGSLTSSAEIHRQTLSSEELALAYYNIAYLRRFTSAV